MAEPKTKKNDASVESFLDGACEDEAKREDADAILAMMQEITGEEPVMWGGSIIGFGSYHYVYASGQEGDWPIAGFSPRKRNFSLYIMAGFDEYDEILERLGKHKTGKSCLYINKLADIDSDVLHELVTASVNYMREKYPDE